MPNAACPCPGPNFSENSGQRRIRSRARAAARSASGTRKLAQYYLAPTPAPSAPSVWQHKRRRPNPRGRRRASPSRIRDHGIQDPLRQVRRPDGGRVRRVGGVERACACTKGSTHAHSRRRHTRCDGPLGRGARREAPVEVLGYCLNTTIKRLGYYS